MKKTIFLVAAIWMFCLSLQAQDKYENQMKAMVAKLDQANAVKDYQQLAGDFEAIAAQNKTKWLPYYYAGFCNAKIGWIYQEDGDKIEPFANIADQQINQAESLIDTAAQKKELSEIYCVLSMVNRARVFINPMSFGSKYGPVAARYTQVALKINPDNPRANYLEGWTKYATPKLWGGDKKKAKELLLLAKQQLEAAPSAGINPHWGKKEVDELLSKLK
jgi:hypothetical protein